MKTSKKLFILSFLTLAFFVFVSKTEAATLSQTSVSVAVGQTSSVYASNVITSLYLTSNSNPNIASVSVVGNNINIYGSAVGNTVATICDNTSVCNTIYITVSGSSSSGTLSLSQTSLSLTTGQTSTVTAYNTYGTSTTLYVSNNSNSSVATATIIGNTISIYGNSAGSSTLTVCQSYNVSCATIYVTVSGGYGYNGTNTLGLNISSLTLSTGGSVTLTSANSNYSGTGLYVSSNSNPNVASTSNSSLVPGCYTGNLYSITTGQLCNNNYTYSNPSYSTTYIPGCYAGAMYSITTGQLCSSINGGNNNGSITISAISSGSDTITLCQNGGACSTMYVTVTGYVTEPLPLSYSPTTYNNSGIPTVYSNSSAN
jgi:hypothetical protein